jgi:Holliday junction resolvasome RuvABC ATP-dependent DNA helicase subunit
LPAPPTEDSIRTFLSPNNSNCPLNNVIVGANNEGTMRFLRRFAFTALKRDNHSCAGCDFAIFAPSGQGKTFAVKMFAKTVELPMATVDCTALSKTWEVYVALQKALTETYDTPLVPYKTGPDCVADVTVPPCIMFFDEAHGIPPKLAKGAILPAMEPDDGLMEVRPGGKGDPFIVDCRNVCWVAATTERGMLFDAFANRLQCLEMEPAGYDELVKIVKLKLDMEEDLPFDCPWEACRIAARYQRVPRDAIKFGRRMIEQKDMHPADTWEEAAQQVATDLGLDQWGLGPKQRAILEALGQRPVALKRLPIVAKCRIEQVEKVELPLLCDYRYGGPLVVAVTGRGMCITRRGLKELEKRGIAHRGDSITAEYFEERRQK